jgi:hypothetical protein
MLKKYPSLLSANVRRSNLLSHFFNHLEQFHVLFKEYEQFRLNMKQLYNSLVNFKSY